MVRSLLTLRSFWQPNLWMRVNLPWWIVLNGSYVISGLCVRENIFWENCALYNLPWNNLSIYLLWLQFFRTNVNVLQMKSCIWQSTHHCQLEQGLLLVNSTHIKPRPTASYLLNTDYVCEHSRCENAATSRSALQAGKNLGASLWLEIQKPFVHLYITH